MPRECPWCGGGPRETVYRLERLPAFQNRVYPSREAARAATAGRISLARCRACGFVGNQDFDPGLMVYDEGYQNEQACSPVFQGHLEEVYALLADRGLLSGRVLEIGCGKATFLDLLWQRGVAAQGCDPAYEGADARVAREYFRPGSGLAAADLVILRHTLEHVAEPARFLREVAAANQGQGRVYIEVPCFAWIVEHKAFFDICHEHCNYFTAATLAALFGGGEYGWLFGGQYLYFLGDLAALARPPRFSGAPAWAPGQVLERARRAAERRLAQMPQVVVWGAGAKGVVFLNLLDPAARRVAGVVDINPQKQGRYLAGTGHLIEGPELLKRLPQAHVLVMNENYLEEIKEMSGLPPDRLHTWEEMVA
ncbi:MAG: methyltransferase domain-containing protein [Deltaproteobacteria bacterium]|nr:methyltransferase domain-containing protein [Deltaproteobacteria bacterium]